MPLAGWLKSEVMLLKQYGPWAGAETLQALLLLLSQYTHHSPVW